MPWSPGHRSIVMIRYLLLVYILAKRQYRSPVQGTGPLTPASDPYTPALGVEEISADFDVVELAIFSRS
jgi:hypothetical protein